MKITTKRGCGLVATAVGIAVALGIPQGAAWAESGEPGGTVELVGFSAQLVLDGVEYEVVNGEVVPAKEPKKAPATDPAPTDGPVVELPAEDPSTIPADEIVVIPGFSVAGADNSSAAAAAAKDSTFPPSGFHKFTSADPYWGFSDLNGSGAEQQKYSNNRTMWGYQLSPTIQRIVAGTIVHQLADRWHGSQRKNYGHHYGVPPNYFFHGSSGSIESRGTYATTFRAEFRHNIGPGGNAVLSAKWNWQRR